MTRFIYDEFSKDYLEMLFSDAFADALRPMLERLSRKGRVRRLDGKKCRGCTSCAPTSLEVYEWIN